MGWGDEQWKSSVLAETTMKDCGSQEPLIKMDIVVYACNPELGESLLVTHPCQLMNYRCN